MSSYTQALSVLKDVLLIYNPDISVLKKFLSGYNPALSVLKEVLSRSSYNPGMSV